MMRPVIVMAGTPVDTQMGMDCLAAQGVEGVFCSISKDPVEQTAFQISSEREKAAVVTALFREAQAAHGCEQAFIYCNSLSGSVDFDAIARETGVAVVTPLDVYRALAPQYRSLAVIAANAQGAAGIERTLLLSNPDLTLRSAGILPVVLAIERGEEPEELVERHRLPELADWFAAQGAEALLLGCTHFPYFKEALSRRTRLPILDPAQEMLRLDLLIKKRRPKLPAALECDAPWKRELFHENSGMLQNLPTGKRAWHYARLEDFSLDLCRYIEEGEFCPKQGRYLFDYTDGSLHDLQTGQEAGFGSALPILPGWEA